MTKISPLLKSHLEAGKNHDRIYNRLTQHANDVKPNEPKAKLIKENLLQSAVSAVQDTYQDGKNFFKASKTGKMNDNNLGRINDLGMKAGALLIATYLAANAKTKTDTIMKFLGGATFFASMSLWPKLFINLPARLVHGFRIDHKYLSAQGDKKDLGLDNQFQPMDIFSDEEMLKMAKKAGIDPKDEFAKEKMQRKLQKTMLQNRTLWMATAGFATPLMTSLVLDPIEPKIRELVVKNGAKKTAGIIGDKTRLSDYLANSKSDTRNVKQLNGLLSEDLKSASLDDNFYKQLADLLNVNGVFKQFKDKDDIKPIQSFKSDNLILALKKVREENSKIDKESLIKLVAGIEEFSSADSLLADTKGEGFGIENAKELFKKCEDRVPLNQVRRILETKFSKEKTDEFISGLKADNSEFFTVIKNYNADVLSKIRGRLKAYIDLLNPIAGSKSESVYTEDFNRTMKGLFEKIGITDKEYRFIEKATLQEQQEFLSAKMSKFVKDNPNYLEILSGKTKAEVKEILKDDMPSLKFKAFEDAISKFVDNRFAKGSAENLKKALTKLFGEDFYLVSNESEFNNFTTHITKDNDIWKGEIFDSYLSSSRFQKLLLSKLYPARNATEELLNQIANPENIAAIGKVDDDVKPLTEALLGDRESKNGIVNYIRTFIKNKRIDLNATKYKPIIASNFEARLASGEFEDLTKGQIKALKNLVYDGTVSMRYNQGEVKNLSEYKMLIKRLFDPKAFKKEIDIIPNFKSELENLAKILERDTETAKYLRAGSLSDLVKNFGTRLSENKTWKKIFWPMAIALVAITLLVQPLFGKIEKEFPKKAKKEGVDNGNK